MGGKNQWMEWSTDEMSALERALSCSRPDFSSLTATPTHFPSPTLPTHTGDLSPASKNHISFLWPSIPIKTNLVGISISQSVCTSFHRVFTLTNGFGILCSKKFGVEQR
ncbi:hypothetical protein AVEN_109933-1 [Araneus ventricosus]|uniref:Uncharacterized protein n=1 Tax=Araneus ventricosus TaxID=182803 RepID=A0A4Y2UEC2_ARAVE|nr:hypothetical protein AVEN_109933-1 [Araneus ventricosus]